MRHSYWGAVDKAKCLWYLFGEFDILLGKFGSYQCQYIRSVKATDPAFGANASGEDMLSIEGGS